MGMSEPERDLSQVFGGLQHRQSAGVSQDVRRDVLRGQRWTRRGRGFDVFREDVFEAGARQRVAAGVDEHLGGGHGAADREPRPQGSRGDFPQGQGALASTLPVDEDARLRLEREVSQLETNQL